MTLTRHDQQVLDNIFQVIQDIQDPQPIPVTAQSAEEAQAVKLFEAGAHQQAIQVLDSLISQCPDNPSLHNNRAQMYRLQRDQNQLAMEDCQRAIQLCDTDPQWAVVKRQSLLQLGWLKLAVDGEEAALPFFSEAAALGSAEARRLAARCNPYSAMCNQMVREMMSTYFSV